MSYPDVFKAIVAATEASHPIQWIREYHKLRDGFLMQQLRTVSPENLERIQGAIGENDQLLKLISEIEKRSCNSQE